MCTRCAGALSPHRVVLTGTHPEYASEAMLDAAEDYVASGGQLIYMGGNGSYWNVGYRAAEPWCMEVRKLNSGVRAWQARPGEYAMATTGQKSVGPGRRRRSSGNEGPQFLSRYPVLNIQAMSARQPHRKARVMPRLAPTLTSALPKKLQRKPLTR